MHVNSIKKYIYIYNKKYIYIIIHLYIFYLL